MNKKMKERMANLFLLLTSVAFCFGLLEFVARYKFQAFPFASNEKPDYMTYLTEKDENLRWRFSPNQDGRNSLGLKGKEIEEKKDSQFRILFLGDSLMWSGENSSGKLYSQFVEESLNSREAVPGKSIDVVNAGIPGYTTYQEFEFLKRYGLGMEPDMVVLGIVFNDVYYKYLHKPSADNMLALDSTHHLNRFDTQKFPGFLFSKSYAIHEFIVLAGKINKKVRGEISYSFAWRGDFYLAWKKYGWRDTSRLVQEMKETLSQENIPLIVLVYPISEQMNEEYLKNDKAYVMFPQSQVREICERNGLPCLDLTEAIYQGGGLNLFSDYLHMNAKGNDILGTEISDFLGGYLESK